MAAVIVLAAVLPALFVLWAFIRWDLFPEPPGLIVATFCLGMASIVPVMLAGDFLVVEVALPVHAMLADDQALLRAAADAFLLAAIPEELVKFAVLLLFCMRFSAFDEPMDGLVYGMTASLGFAALENVLYLARAGEDWVDVAILRALLSVPSHGLDGAIMGFFAGLARFEPERQLRWWTLALVVPICLHGLYNTPLFLIDMTEPAEPDAPRSLSILLPPMIVAAEIVWAVALFRRLSRDQHLRIAAGA